MLGQVPEPSAPLCAHRILQLCPGPASQGTTRPPQPHPRPRPPPARAVLEADDGFSTSAPAGAGRKRWNNCAPFSSRLPAASSALLPGSAITQQPAGERRCSEPESLARDLPSCTGPGRELQRAAAAGWCRGLGPRRFSCWSKPLAGAAVLSLCRQPGSSSGSVWFWKDCEAGNELCCSGAIKAPPSGALLPPSPFCQSLSSLFGHEECFHGLAGNTEREQNM